MPETAEMTTTTTTTARVQHQTAGRRRPYERVYLYVNYAHSGYDGLRGYGGGKAVVTEPLVALSGAVFDSD